MEDVLLALEEESRRRLDAVRALLREKGRDDLVADLDAELRNVRLGVTAARSAWHSISPAQRRALEALRAGGWFRRSGGSTTRYDAVGGPEGIANICGIATARALCAHELIACNGGVFDPESRFVLTERGRFVLSAALQPTEGDRR
jgi:hypothetical protein